MLFYRYDFVDVGRQVLQDLYHIYYNNFTAAYRDKSLDKAT